MSSSLAEKEHASVGRSRGLGGLKAMAKSRRLVEGDALASLREEAAVRFEAGEWPTGLVEEWRRSPVTAFDFNSLAYGPLPAAASTQRSAKVAPSGVKVPSYLCRPVDVLGEACADFGAEDLAAVVQIRHSDSDTELGLYSHPDLKGVEVLDLLRLASLREHAHARSRDRALVLFDSALKQASDRFVHWNLAAFDSAVYIRIGQNFDPSMPLVIDYHTSCADDAAMPLFLIDLESGSHAELIIRLASDGAAFVNSVLVADVGDGGRLRTSLVQDISEDGVWIHHGYINVGRDAMSSTTELSIGAAWVKARTALNLSAAGSDGYLNGAYIADGERHMDLRTVQNHRSPHAHSRALYKGVVADQAHTIYSGLIDVARDAFQTDAYLTNRNLVLSDGARAESIPTLEIKTNDVKCSHGSTTGRINADSLFYLQNRGFSRAEAERMIVQAFLGEACRDMHLFLSEYVSRRLSEIILRRESSLHSGTGAGA